MQRKHFLNLFSPHIKRSALPVLLLLTSAIAAQAQVIPYSDLQDFGGTIPNGSGGTMRDGIGPAADLTIDSQRNIYGTTVRGGVNGVSEGGFGTAFKITRTGAFTQLHSFGGAIVNANGKPGLDGINPAGSVTLDSKGNMYGVATLGGPNTSVVAAGAGMLWEITAAGVYKDLHDFGGVVINANGKPGLDGIAPSNAITFDAAGNMYGTTTEGGANASTVGGGIAWEITATGKYIDLHDFFGSVKDAAGVTSVDGAYPSSAALVFGEILFGVCEQGGPNGKGLIWTINKGVYSDLHDFGGTIKDQAGATITDGKEPVGASIDSKGDLFGTTQYGGAHNSDGILWELPYKGVYQDLHDFGGTTTLANGQTGPDGINPLSDVAFDSAGNLFGTTSGGTKVPGTVWELSAAGVYTDLHDFGGLITQADGKPGADGVFPTSGVTFDTAGNIYGSAYKGARYNGGLVWRMATAPALASLVIAPGEVVGTFFGTGTVTLNRPAPVGGIPVKLNGFTDASVPSGITVPAGSTTATFTVKTPPVAANTSGSIIASYLTVTKTATFKIDAPSLSGFTMDHNTVNASVPGSELGHLTVTGMPVSAGAVVKLTATGVTVPSTVTIHSGTVTASFDIQWAAVTATTKATITATCNGVTKQVILTLNK